jgi:nucleoside-diphosphate kinase
MEIPVQKTLAIIKPDAIDRAEEIIEDIKQHKFAIVQQRCIRLSPEQAADFYAEHYGKMFFPSLVAFMSSREIMVLVLAKPDAISSWRDLIGQTDARRAKEEQPNCLRAKYGHDNTKNGLHGSDSVYSAEREIKFMFIDRCGVLEPVKRSDNMRDYLEKNINPTLIKGLTELSKQKPEDPLVRVMLYIISTIYY